MVAIFEPVSSSSLDRVDRFQRLRSDNKERGGAASARSLRFDVLGADSRPRTVESLPRTTDFYRRDDRVRRDSEQPQWDDSGSDRDTDAPRDLLPFLATADELALLRSFGPWGRGDEYGQAADFGGAANFGGAAAVGGVGEARSLAERGFNAPIAPTAASQPFDDGSTDGATFTGSATVSPNAGYKFYYARQTGYGASRSIGGSQSYYTPHGQSAGYPDYVERSSNTVYGGTAVIRLSNVGLDLSVGTPPEAYGLA